MSYEDDRIESWARKIYEGCKPRSAASWDSIAHGPAAERWRRIARAAIEAHLQCCERRCKKCDAVFVHFCAHCDRS